jgi:NO-binding membrane sensor protein with MHYT domain
MAEVHHFSYGLWTPLLAYIMSCTGSLLGLLLTARARAAEGRGRSLWLVLGALSIGGTGIWVMHFIAMLGFSVPRAEIRYDVPLTLLSAVIAVTVVGTGLFTVGFGGPRRTALLLGGIVTGAGVASMHYTGMAAMRVDAHVTYDRVTVGLSVLIAMVAATAALWFTIRVRGTAATVGATLIMGVAVSGMHYTGMAAMRVRVDPNLPSPTGAAPVTFLLPLIIGISVVAMLLLTIVAMSPNEDEMRFDAELLERIRQSRVGGPGQPVQGAPGRHAYRTNGRPEYGPKGGPEDAPNGRHAHRANGRPAPPHGVPAPTGNEESTRAGRWFGGR